MKKRVMIKFNKEYLKRVLKLIKENYKNKNKKNLK